MPSIYYFMVIHLPQMMKNASIIDGETLPSKYDINELEFLRDEFRNGTTVKNGARECIGGPPTPLFLLLWHMGRGRVMLVDEQF